MPHPEVFRVSRARVTLLAVAAPVLLIAATCHDGGGVPCVGDESHCVVEADSVVIQPARNDSVVIQPATAGGMAVRLAIDSVVIQPSGSGGRLVRIYPR